MQLHVLPLTWTDLRYRYTFHEVWPVLCAADLATAPLVLSQPDIQAYDWTHQEIWLAAATVQRLRETGLDRLFHTAVGQAFVVTLDQERLYGGLFYYHGGAAGIQFPVIHALGAAGDVLRIRPALGGAWRPEDTPFPAESQRIADPRLAAWLRARHLFVTGPLRQRPAGESDLQGPAMT